MSVFVPMEARRIRKGPDPSCRDSA
jgi:hypothetical protein